MEEYKLLDNQSRYELQEIYDKLKKFSESIDIEFEEFFAIKTLLEYLNNAINYKKKFLN